VVGDNRPLYSRRIHDCGFSLVLEAIMRAFDVTLDEAQHLVEAYGLLSPNADSQSDYDIPRAIANAAETPIQELLGQVGRTLEFMSAQRRQLRPSAIWLLGGGASMRNVGPVLEQVVQLPVHVWQMAADDRPLSCASGSRAAVFAEAVALSALAWRAA
jgi:Tfp pilus assembly PilM family ATPase